MNALILVTEATNPDNVVVKYTLNREWKKNHSHLDSRSQLSATSALNNVRQLVNNINKTIFSIFIRV